MDTAHATTADGRRIHVDPLSAVLWHLALRLHPWDLVVDVGVDHGETPDEVMGPMAQAVCLNVDAKGRELEVLNGAVATLDGRGPYAVMLEVLHLPAFHMADLAACRATYLMDRRTHRLIRIPGGNARVAERLRGSAWLYSQHCLVLSDDLAAVT